MQARRVLAEAGRRRRWGRGVRFGFCAGWVSVLPSGLWIVTSEAGGRSYEGRRGEAVYVWPVRPRRRFANGTSPYWAGTGG